MFINNNSGNSYNSAVNNNNGQVPINNNNGQPPVNNANGLPYSPQAVTIQTVTTTVLQRRPEPRSPQHTRSEPLPAISHLTSSLVDQVTDMVYNNAVYTGDVSSITRQPHGNGQERVNHNGSSVRVYEGKYANGIKHGSGAMLDHGAVRYVGHISNNKAHGKGTYTYPADNAYGYPEGTKYEGNFANNMRHGEGSLIHPEGFFLYKGEWSNDQKHGLGKSYANGSVEFEGEWQSDSPHGNGTFHLPNGSTRTGNWIAGNLHGEVTIVDTRLKATYEGPYVMGKAHGIAKVTSHENGVTIEAYFIYDKQVTKEQFESFMNSNQR
jgi:hypothetical protein